MVVVGGEMMEYEIMKRQRTLEKGVSDKITKIMFMILDPIENDDELTLIDCKHCHDHG